MNDPPSLRVGIVGCGNIAARMHAPTWLEFADLVRVVAVADPHPDARERLRRRLGLPAADAHADAGDLIARADIDIVDVCTPQAFRRDLLVRAAEAGKHILCEKPLATVPADAAAAVEAAERHGVVLGIVHNYVALPEIMAARKVLDAGEIGTVRSVIANFLGVVYEPGAAGDWRRDPELAGGGVLMDMIHGVYAAEWLLGEPFRRVSAYVAGRTSDWYVEDLSVCRFESESKVALVNIGWGHGPGGIVITGTEGRIDIRYEHGATAPWAVLEQVTVTTDSGTQVVLGAPAERRQGQGEFPTMASSFRILARAFAEAVRDGGQPLANGRDGLRSLEATVAAYESAATGRLVDLPLDRANPTFLRGAIGIRDHVQANWSPLRGTKLFRSPDAEHEEQR